MEMGKLFYIFAYLHISKIGSYFVLSTKTEKLELEEVYTNSTRDG